MSTSDKTTEGFTGFGLPGFSLPKPLGGEGGNPMVGGLASGVEFLRNFWGRGGAGASPLPGFVLPSFDVEELDKRITDLRAVEGWLDTNLSMLHTAIQALEVQRNTVATLKSFGEAMKGGSGKAAEPEPTSMLGAMFEAMSPRRADAASAHAPATPHVSPDWPMNTPTARHHAKPEPEPEPANPANAAATWAADSMRAAAEWPGAMAAAFGWPRPGEAGAEAGAAAASAAPTAPATATRAATPPAATKRKVEPEPDPDAMEEEEDFDAPPDVAAEQAAQAAPQSAAPAAEAGAPPAGADAARFMQELASNASMANASAWWNLMQEQFARVASAAMQGATTAADAAAAAVQTTSAIVPGAEVAAHAMKQAVDAIGAAASESVGKASFPKPAAVKPSASAGSASAGAANGGSAAKPAAPRKPAARSASESASAGSTAARKTTAAKSAAATPTRARPRKA